MRKEKFWTLLLCSALSGWGCSEPGRPKAPVSQEPDSEEASPDSLTDGGVRLGGSLDGGETILNTLNENDGGPNGLQPETIYPITGQGTIAEAITQEAGDFCFFDNDHYLTLQGDRVLYWSFGGLAQNQADRPNGRLLNCGLLEDGSPFLLTDETMWVFDGLGWGLSPLAAAWGNELPVDAVHLWDEDLGDTFYFAFQSELLYWAEGLLYSLDVEGLPTANASLSLGQVTLEGEPRGLGVWVAAAGWVYALTQHDGSFSAYVLAEDLYPTDAVAFGTDRFAMATEGNVFLHSGEGMRHLQLPEPVTALWGRPTFDNLFLGTDRPKWWLRSDGRLVQLMNLPGEGSWNLDASGELVLARNDGLHRHHLQPHIRWRGLTPGTVLKDDRYVALSYGGWGLVEVMEVTLNDVPFQLDIDDGIALVLAQPDPNNWAIDSSGAPLVSPEQLFDGAQTLKASILFEDGIEVSSELPFVVGALRTPTWEEDVKPLYEERCALCHYEGSNTYELHQRSHWQENFDTIFYAIETGQMPLPTGSNDAPIDASELEMLTRWSVADFPATAEDIVVSPPQVGFADDIRPIFDAHCATCHGATGGARNLETATAWQTEIDNIISTLESGMMPLGADPLPQDEIDLVKDWRNAGFLP